MKLHRNVWVTSLASFLTDVSSEMVLNLLPLFLSDVLGLGMGIIGFVEGIAESVSSLLKIASGWLPDRVAKRNSLAVRARPTFLFGVAGFGLAASPLVLFSSTEKKEHS